MRPKLPKRPALHAAAQPIGCDGADGAISATAVPARLQVAAASRLVAAASAGGRQAAARRFLASASEHGIDPSLMWATIGSGPMGGVRQVCLAVPGSGRTATLFLAPPDRLKDLGDPAQQHAERVAAARAACDGLAQLQTPEVVLAQSLPEPGEPWAVRAFLEAGFERVGDLAYLSRPLDPPGGPIPDGPWPDGIEVVTVASLGDAWEEPVLEALEASYEGTLDCPALCGLRQTEDVLASHRATGRWDPSLWWLVRDRGAPRGVALFTHCPEARSVELVYLGLGPTVRGRGLGRRLMALGIASASGLDADELTCAVDKHNAPALGLYESVGMTAFAQRVALVRPIQRCAARVDRA